MVWLLLTADIDIAGVRVLSFADFARDEDHFTRSPGVSFAAHDDDDFNLGSDGLSPTNVFCNRIWPSYD